MDLCASRVTIDFETKSRLSLKKHGISRYARHPSTDTLCLAYAKDDQPEPDVWHPLVGVNAFSPTLVESPIPSVLLQAIEEEWEFHAHNAPFEVYIWFFVMALKHGWPTVPPHCWRCTAAKSAYANMPRALEDVARLLNSGQDLKDKEGRTLMQKMTKPRRMTKKLIAAGASEWIDDGESHARLRVYCKRDVKAERGVDHKLPPWPETEKRLWQLDRKINQHGIPVDLALCRGAVQILARCKKESEAEIARVTKDEITTLGQVQRMVKYAQKRGVEVPTKLKRKNGKMVEVPTLEEQAVTALLKDQRLPTDVRRVLQLRRLNGLASVKKFQATLNFADDDGRARELLLYYGAGTGRWSGKAIQPHNFKRGPATPQCVIDAITTGDYDHCTKYFDMNGDGWLDVLAESPWNAKKQTADLSYFDLVYPKQADGTRKFIGLVRLLGTAVKPIVCAPSGRKLVVSDFSGIEARVLQWFARGEQVLRMFRNGEDIYVDMACKIYNCSPTDILDPFTKKPRGDEGKRRRQIGKVAILGLGYGMGALKFIAMVKQQAGITIDLDFAQKVVGVYRKTNQPVVKLWRAIERACIAAVRDGKHIEINKLLKIKMEGEYLTIRLPSGRKLYYFRPQVKEEEGDYGPRYRLTYLQKKGRQETYGGKLVENIVQAASRDLLVFSMFLADERGLAICLHVHDECVAECDRTDNKAASILHTCMTTIPAWAAGCPVNAETHSCIRYTK